jgi:hypothetical protein
VTGVIPVVEPTVEDILYGSRTTTIEYELYSHDPATGVDSLIGLLDGVQPDGELDWDAGESVKKAGTINVADVEVANPGTIRVADVDLLTTRVRPVRKIVGLPAVPLSMYEITAGPVSWSDAGRVFALELHDKSTVLDQDAVDETFTAGTDVPILSIVQQVIESAGERITVDASQTLRLPAPRSWDAGTSKLAIVNDLLKVLGYNALWVDGVGNFRATPYVEPADRSATFEVLVDEDGNAIARELVDGERSIYSPEWKQDRDVWGVPNKVIAIQSRTDADVPPLSGVATNENPDSPFSYSSRGRWITPEDGPLSVDVPDYGAPFDALPGLVDTSVSFRGEASTDPGWSDAAHDLADQAVAAAAAVLAIFPDLASAQDAAAKAATLHTAAYATTQVEATIDAAALAFETSAGVVVTDGVDVVHDAIVAFLEAAARQSLIARTAVQETDDVDCLPFPFELLDALRFASAPAGIDGRRTIQSATIPLSFDGSMSLSLLEVVSL